MLPVIDVNLDKCTLEQLLALFDIKNLNESELKNARKKVLQLHPDKNPHLDTRQYYEYFSKAYDKIKNIYSYVHHETDVSKVNKSIEIDTTFKNFIEKSKLDKKGFHEKFNEMFENVYIKENDGYAEWLKSDEAMYNKDNLEESRRNAMSLIVANEVTSAGSSSYYSDIKDAYVNSVITVDQDKLFNDKKKFNSVEEYMRHRNENLGETLTEKESMARLSQTRKAEGDEALTLSFSFLNKEQDYQRKQNEYNSKFLMIK